MGRLVIAIALVVGNAVGCASVEASAAKDPMRCERDPKCAKKSRDFDCSSQCADDPACVDRCRQINAGTDPAMTR